MSKKLIEGQMNDMVVKGYKLIKMDARGNKTKRVSATGSVIIPHLAEVKQGRNSLCDCGSGAKYKNCCGRV